MATVAKLVMIGIVAGALSTQGLPSANSGKRGIGDIVRALVLLWERLEPDEMVGQVKYL